MAATDTSKKSEGVKKASHGESQKRKKMTPTTQDKLKVQSTIFDLDSFEEVTLIKEGVFTPITSLQEAQERLGNSTSKLLEVLNRGMRAEAANSLKTDSAIPFLVLNEDGTTSEFTGTPADAKQVNTVTLTLAKTVFGYKSEGSIESRRAAKEQARQMIKNVDAIREGLKANAATASSDSE